MYDARKISTVFFSGAAFTMYLLDFGFIQLWIRETMCGWRVYENVDISVLAKMSGELQRLEKVFFIYTSNFFHLI